ncbi:type II toxin-antitoxin system VapC family toxin [Sphingomonas sp. BIUV-7]|uniref:Type II toxin-antitoxin system VapC family toxin n=1 Tax=Sphingomonas natans TaxID=3063330 RepID=A0ABT8Y6G5_9SPHN|nr:type II toxin-antitoxin system VapC family toxin [Sphingomonas sp. BIUV-7]MDO6413901.1 type II toxin-antitoxin system VapC family toxin [Sphingomonas sp. BIUV-7]
MHLTHLLDTNVCIVFALGRSASLQARMNASAPGTLAMSAVTFGELAVGAKNSADPQGDKRRLAALSRFVLVQPFDRAAGEAYGSIARTGSFRRGSFDRLIGAHASALGLILATNNERDFADIPGLKIENWTLPL